MKMGLMVLERMADVTIKAFIFDLDGVITDTAEFHYLAWKRLADEEGIPFNRDDNEQLRGVSRRESLARMLKGRQIAEPTAQLWMTRKNEYYKEYLKTISPKDALPGVPALLTAVRAAGLKIGLGSASKNATDVLDRLDLRGHFDAIGDGYSVVNTKPAPDLFIWVAGALGVPPNEAIVVEDAEAGIDAALAGGFYTVGVGTANVHRAHLTAPGVGSLTVADVLGRIGV
jgi:beta-phosphoglucomutase